jgi:hypothetical protein
MPAYIYTKLVKDASKSNIEVTERSKKAFTWLRQRYADISKASVTAVKFINEADRKRKRGMVGRMYMFLYDPKGKEELPFYDRFPLIFFVKPTKGGFYGINLHYLPPILRAKLLDALYETQVNGVVGNETTRMKFNYDLLASAARFRLFRPCFKKYLYGQTNSSLIYVPPEEWNMTVFLPTENFKKATKEEVWKDSRRQIG